MEIIEMEVCAQVHRAKRRPLVARAAPWFIFETVERQLLAELESLLLPSTN